MDKTDQVLHELTKLTHLLNQRLGSACNKSQVDELATKHDLHRMEEKFMSAIGDFAAKLKAFQDKEDAAVADLIVRVKGLQDTLTAIQNSAGTISPEDQASLDAALAQAQSVSDKLAALDSTVAPTPPAA